MITTDRLGQGSPLTLGGEERSRRGNRRLSTSLPQPHDFSHSIGKLEYRVRLAVPCPQESLRACCSGIATPSRESIGSTISCRRPRGFSGGPEWLRGISREPLGKPGQLPGPLIHEGPSGLPPAGLRLVLKVSGRREGSDRGRVARRTSRHVFLSCLVNAPAICRGTAQRALSRASSVTRCKAMCLRGPGFCSSARGLRGVARGR